MAEALESVSYTHLDVYKRQIWDSWADEDGAIGKAYGYQMSVKHQYKEGMMDQVDRVIYDLKNNPYSRRIMTNIYVHQDLHEMNLYPVSYTHLDVYKRQNIHSAI